MKSERHAKVVELIKKYDIETQEDLADRLNREGYNVTQATVSRDIRELKLTKVSDGGKKQKYVVPDGKEGIGNDRFIRILREAYVSVDMAQNILVVKTVAGMAMAAAAAVDAMNWNEIVGCIAGDDTIMCAVRTVDDTKNLMEKIRRLVSAKDTR